MSSRFYILNKIMKGVVKIYEPMLECYIRILYWEWGREKFEEYVREVSWIADYKSNSDADGLTCPRGLFLEENLTYVMWVEDANNISVFMHELYHLVSAIDREYTIGEEACAFLVGYVVREFNKRFV